MFYTMALTILNAPSDAREGHRGNHGTPEVGKIASIRPGRPEGKLCNLVIIIFSLLYIVWSKSEPVLAAMESLVFTFCLTFASHRLSQTLPDWSSSFPNAIVGMLEMSVGSLCNMADIFLLLRQDLLEQTAVLKLNGGLGTSMGLEKAKSLLPVKDGKTFPGPHSRANSYTRKKFGSKVRFILMNRSATTLACLLHHTSSTEQHRTTQAATQPWNAAPALHGI